MSIDGLSSKVENFSPKPVSDGILVDEDGYSPSLSISSWFLFLTYVIGTILLTDPSNSAIHAIYPNRTLVTLLQDYTMLRYVFVRIKAQRTGEQ